MCSSVDQIWFGQVFRILIISLKVYFVEAAVGRCDEHGRVCEPFSLGEGLVEDLISDIVQMVFNLVRFFENAPHVDRAIFAGSEDA